MNNEETATRLGIIDSVKKLMTSTLAMIQTRAELVGVEFREERERWLKAIIIVTSMALFTGMALMLMTLGILLYFWETHLAWAMGILVFLYLAATGLCYLFLTSRMKKQEAFFETLEQFKKDQECLKH